MLSDKKIIHVPKRSVDIFYYGGGKAAKFELFILYKRVD